jgi:uncharacterized protein (DUF2249 family)
MTESLSFEGMDPCSQHERLLSRFDALALGDSLDLLDRQDPQPLFFQLATSRRGQFDWHYLQQGPQVWMVRVTRLAIGPSQSYERSCPCNLTGRS